MMLESLCEITIAFPNKASPCVLVTLPEIVVIDWAVATR